MIFKHFMLDVLEANAFVLACSETNEAIMIDAGQLPESLVRFVDEQGLHLNSIFITHGHHDHTDGLANAVHQFGAKVYASSGEVGGLPTERVKHGDTVSVGTLEGRVLATPGHTPDGVSLAFPGHVFTGDALFAGSVGGTASPELAAQQVEHVRRNLFSLPADTLVHCGHGPSSTIGIESRYNPFFV